MDSRYLILGNDNLEYEMIKYLDYDSIMSIFTVNTVYRDYRFESRFISLLEPAKLDKCKNYLTFLLKRVKNFPQEIDIHIDVIGNNQKGYLIYYDGHEITSISLVKHLWYRLSIQLIYRDKDRYTLSNDDISNLLDLLKLKGITYKRSYQSIHIDLNLSIKGLMRNQQNDISPRTVNQFRRMSV